MTTHAHAFEWDPDRVVVVDRDPRYGKCERRGCWVCDVRRHEDRPVRADVRTALVGLFLDFVEDAAAVARPCAD